jgi:hypothetical protein
MNEGGGREAGMVVTGQGVGEMREVVEKLVVVTGQGMGGMRNEGGGR